MAAIFTALLLGLLTILDPCTLFTSITAISYIDRELANRRKVLLNGLMFVLGKLATYVLLSVPFIMGAQTEGIQHILEHYSEPILGVFMIICGGVLLYSGHHHHNHDHGMSKWLQSVGSESSWIWSFMLAYHAHCLARKLQRGQHRQFDEQTAHLREVVPVYLCRSVPRLGYIFMLPHLPPPRSRP